MRRVALPSLVPPQAAVRASLEELELQKADGELELAELEAAIAASLALEVHPCVCPRRVCCLSLVLPPVSFPLTHSLTHSLTVANTHWRLFGGHGRRSV